ncbi:uncharacterized protein LOC115452425 [Manduca sexta]|uniref:uncharacterized protein LOC115452425 n=1 Tax=Manduca sexta TaxID=7130 RepID=UPI00188FF54C|nr:uncharacterized protein LOC115452425 [Manduca sexta]
MKIIYFLKRFFDKLCLENDDPVEAAKIMITFIQQFVGIHNVFGDEGRSYSLLSVIAVVIFGGTFVYVGTFSQIVYLVHVFPDKSETFKVFNCLSATSVPLSKYIFMWTSRSRLKTVFQMCKDGLSSIPADSTSHVKMMKTLQKARFVSWLVVGNQAIVHVAYLVVPFLFTVFGNNRYLPSTPGDSYGLSPKYETPYYETTFALTCIGTVFSGINQTGYIVLFITLCAHELAHFYAITEMLKDVHQTLTKENNLARTKIVNEKLRFCVKHHQFLMQYHIKIRELYKIIFGAHFLMMTIVLVTTLQTMNSWDMRNTILTAVTGIMPLFLYCFGGELLITAGLDMSTAVYTCGWELMDGKQARLVLLMLCLSQRPLSLTAADIFIMNRETFGKVVQVVYKIYAVFN